MMRNEIRVPKLYEMIQLYNEFRDVCGAPFPTQEDREMCIADPTRAIIASLPPLL